jgi:hypothetical protein
MHQQKASFAIFRSSVVSFHLMFSMVAKIVSLRPIFRVENSRNHLEWDLKIMLDEWWQECFSRRGIATQQAMCGLLRYRDAETTVPATCFALPPNCFAQPLQNVHVETNSRCSRPSISKNSGKCLLSLVAALLVVHVHWSTFSFILQQTD